MITIDGQFANRFCDEQTRCNFLKIGSLGLVVLSMAQLLWAETANQVGSSNMSVIMVYLPGGPPHQDIVDPLDAPVEIRGEFRPISTKVAGMQICEHLPRLAKLADKLAIIRSMVGAKDRHESFQCMTCRPHYFVDDGYQPIKDLV